MIRTCIYAYMMCAYILSIVELGLQTVNVLSMWYLETTTAAPKVNVAPEETDNRDRIDVNTV